jgi:spore coat polysaccharide biosynthesis protein SpsF
MSIVAIVQARIGSTRLPGKVMKDLAGKPMLLRVLNRVSAASMLNKVIVAIPDLPESSIIERLCAVSGYCCFKGSEQDLLDRYYRTAVAHCADTIVRITADCPLIDPGLIDTVVQRYLQCPSMLKYASNIHPTRTYPRGLDTEVFGFDTLESAWRNDRNQAWREHVTPFVYRHPEKYEIIGVTHPEDYSGYRLTVDTPEDFQLIELLYQWFNEKPFNWLDIINLLCEKPDWSRMNSAIEQKVIG